MGRRVTGLIRSRRFVARYDCSVIFTFGDCPIDPGDGIPYVVALTGNSPVLLYCPSCGCAWASASDVEHDPTRGLPEFGLSEATIRYATEDEVEAAGHEIAGTHAPWWELPRGPENSNVVVRILSEFDFHLVVLYVALAIPVLGFPLPGWLRLSLGLLIPQGRIWSHAWDLRDRGEPSWPYVVMNEALVVAVVGAYVFFR